MTSYNFQYTYSVPMIIHINDKIYEYDLKMKMTHLA